MPRPLTSRTATILALAGANTGLAASMSLAQSDPLSEPFPAVFELGVLRPDLGGDGSLGVFLSGAGMGDGAGTSVSGASDINADGIDDVLINAVGGDPLGRSGAGETYVIFGRTEGHPAEVPLGGLDGNNGFTIAGVASGDSSGYSVSFAGDVNGDGLDDLIVGAPQFDFYGTPRGPGAAFVVFGRDDGFAAIVDLAELDGTDGFRIDGVEDSDQFGWAVAGAGDITGDGIADVAIGATNAGPGYGNGAAYVVFGRGTPAAFPARLMAADLDGTDGFRIGSAGSFGSLGRTVSAAGDLNGDGIGDLAVGDPFADIVTDTEGSVNVVFGRDTTAGETFGATLIVEDLDGLDGTRLAGPADRGIGGAICPAGDLNGDGFDDLAVSAQDAAAGGRPYAGRVFVLYGRDAAAAGPFERTIRVADLDGDDGFSIEGVGVGDRSGHSLAGLRDVNGDGADDLAIGAFTADPGGVENAGSIFVLFGTTAGYPPSVELADLDGANGFRINGVDDFDLVGTGVAGAGDVNADGRPDVVIGASGSGDGFILYGRGASGCPADLDGDGTLTIFDFLAFQNLFDLMDPTADFDGDGDFTIFDFLAFQNAFDAGCP